MARIHSPIPNSFFSKGLPRSPRRVINFEEKASKNFSTLFKLDATVRKMFKVFILTNEFPLRKRFDTFLKTTSQKKKDAFLKMEVRGACEDLFDRDGRAVVEGKCHFNEKIPHYFSMVVYYFDFTILN